ncbi:MAG TPA: Ig-like domain-containing protein, partial [Lacunisphaera sp.]|nr:Ig-like domain-containing protein [Lacunisphaera sp.]
MSLSVLVRSRARLLSALFASALASAPLCAVPAFPGAEGFGANATGGRGGSVYVVTNLNDSGAGSFRDAVSAPNRTVIFAVGGVIRISSRIAVKNNLTIAGQTAPGGGITIYGNGVSFSDASNTICRYIRFRQGISGDGGTDAVGIASGDSMIFDHVSASWGRDETFSVSGTPSNITLQDCIVGQGLLAHSAGGLMQTDGGVSVFRSLYADNWMRNPKVKGKHEFTNNVVYNWGSGGGYIMAGDSAGQTFANISNNYFIAGPNSPAAPFAPGNLNFHAYTDNNLHDADRDGVLNGTIVPPAGYPSVDLVATRHAYPAVATLLTPAEAYVHIVANAGASLPRDQVDAYMVNELTSLGTVGAQIVNESEVGGPGTVAGGVAPTDSDSDGMPDWWEQAAGTNPGVADNNGDLNGDGYTNLENYLNALAPAGVPGAFITGITTDTGSSAADGVTSDNTLVLQGTSAPGRTITLSRVDTGVIGTAVADAGGSWSFDYTGTTLADRYYAFTAAADLGGGVMSPSTRAFAVQVDTTAPAAPVINGLAVSPAYVFNGTATPGDQVLVTQVGFGPVATATTDPLGRWSAPYSGVPPPAGVYSFTAAAIDLAGNPGSDSAPYVVNTGLTPPAFTGITDDTGASASDQITRDTTLNLSGTAPASSTVTVTRQGTGIIGTAVATAGGTWTFNYTGTTLPSGDYIFTATAATAGTSSPVSAPFAVKVDTVAPTIDTIVRFNPPTAATSSSTLVFRVTFFEPVVNVDAGDFVLTTSGASGTISSLSPVNASVYDVTVTGASGDGTIRLDRRANSTIQDLAGNAGSSGTFTGGQSYTMRLPGSSVWASTDSGVWSDAANWEDAVIANGAGATADFGARDIDGDVTVDLDSPRTIGRLVFGDIDQASPGTWTLANNGNPANVLSLASVGAPTIQVNYTGATGVSNPDIAIAGAAYPATITAQVNTATGLTKSGWGTAILTNIGSYGGPLNVTQGRLKLGPGGVLTVPSVALAVSSQFEVAGGTFASTGDATMVSGTGVGYVVSAGTASFQRIVPTNARNNLVKVTGGSLTATELNFPRSADAANMYQFGLVVTGGEATINTVGLGTVNSWGNMSIEGGRLNVSDLTIAWQQTSGRGGQARVTGGELVVNEVIMSRKNGSNANNVAELHLLGGTTTVNRLTLGFDATVNAGSATVNLNGGALYLGAGGIVRNGVAPFAANLNLTNGTLGAAADWATDVPLNVSGGVVVLQAADADGIAHDITLGGAIAGSGDIVKTGGGTLQLPAASSFSGSLSVNAGAVRVLGTLPTGGAITINAAGAVIGSGNVLKPIVLNGVLAPGGAAPDAALAGSSLAWNGGGQLALTLGASGTSNRLNLSGALTRGTAGNHVVQLTAGTGFAAGNTYTLATFASTDFAAADFTATGLPPGYAAQLSLGTNSLTATIIATPVITSAASAAGTFNAAFNYAITATNDPTSYHATGLPAGLSIDPGTGVISGTPAASGTFNVTLEASNLAGTGMALLTLTIAKAPSSLVLTSLQQPYDGSPKSPTAVTTPSGLTVTFTYDGNATAPTLPGGYSVVATIDDPNYSGTTSDAFVITITGLVRHAPTLNGDVDGSVQVLLPENVTLAGSSMVGGGLLLPGTPSVVIHGSSVLGSTIDYNGAATPTSHTVTLNGNAMLGHLGRRVDALAMPVVAPPPAPAGTRNVAMNSSSQSPGDFATLRNLTLSGSAGMVAVPPGTYGNFSASGNSGFILGVAGSTEPAVYNLQNLSVGGLPGGAPKLQVVGPVI